MLPAVELVSLDEVAPELELEEPFDTFHENALNKARAVVVATGLPAFADDSGLEVDLLNGEPGVRSARYAGPAATDKDNNAKLVEQLREARDERPRCRYRCVAVFVSPDGSEVVEEAVCEGTITLQPRGSLGFGYDPHFIPAEESRTMAEIPLDERLRLSHRGRAFRALARRLRQDRATTSAG